MKAPNPCPFCGHAPELKRVNLIHPEGKFFSYAVRCVNHRCHIQPTTYDTDKPARTKTEAAKRWTPQPKA